VPHNSELTFMWQNIENYIIQVRVSCVALSVQKDETECNMSAVVKLLLTASGFPWLSRIWLGEIISNGDLYLAGFPADVRAATWPMLFSAISQQNDSNTWFHATIIYFPESCKISNPKRLLLSIFSNILMNCTYKTFHIHWKAFSTFSG
jgi:hypothetical protein